MNLRPRHGLPLLAALLLLSAVLDPPWHLLALVAAMAAALWTAFSLPKPPPRPQTAQELLFPGGPPADAPQADDSQAEDPPGADTEAPAPGRDVRRD